MRRCLVLLCLLSSLMWPASGAGQDRNRLRTTMFHDIELPYEIIDGLAIHAGDIVLGTAEEAAAHAPERIAAGVARDS